MNYFELMDFKTEPFSNSPDPDLFYQSGQHLEVLQKLEIAIRLKRGLNVVTGDVGTGKTTVSRQLIQKLSHDKTISYGLVLDPGFDTAAGFLGHICRVLNLPGKDDLDEAGFKERIKTHLFSRVVEAGVTQVLIIDEGQKLSRENLEILRELLNFETNYEKLLQIVIFAQTELDRVLVENFRDRINLWYRLDPLGFMATKALIQFRLNQCFIPGRERTVFTGPAFLAVYAATRGFPRKIVTLCHQILLSLIIFEKKQADFLMVRSCARNGVPHPHKRARTAGIILGCLLALALALVYVTDGRLPAGQSGGGGSGELPADASLLDPATAFEAGGLTGGSAALGEAIPAAAGPGVSPGSSAPYPARRNPSFQLSPETGYGYALIPAGETLYELSILVYGNYSDRLLARLMQSNPHVASPKQIATGTPLFFPFPEAPAKTSAQRVFLVLFKSRNFNQAIQAAAARRHLKLDLRIMPTDLGGEAPGFAVVAGQSFKHREEARAYLAQRRWDTTVAVEPILTPGNPEWGQP